MASVPTIVGNTVESSVAFRNPVEAKLRIYTQPVVLDTCKGDSHGDGIHDSLKWEVEASSKLTVNGYQVAKSGDPTTCGHIMLFNPGYPDKLRTI